MPPMQTVDFTKLDMATLKRYKRHYRLKTRQNVTKTELALAVAKHFASQHVDEVRPPAATATAPAFAPEHPASTGWLGRRRPSSSSCILQGRARCNTVRTPHIKKSNPNRTRPRPRARACV